MKKILFLLTFLPSITFSQDRIDSDLPKIIDTLSSITTATGWMKNEIGKWVSKPNAIPGKYSDLNSNCVEFIEYQLLKVSYYEENYFCIIHKTKNETNYFLINYFKTGKIDLADTTFFFGFKPLYEGSIRSPIKLKQALINCIAKNIQNESSLAKNDYMQIYLSINREKNYLRFLISTRFSLDCSNDESTNGYKYFETKISNLSFFEHLISAN
jgi:hypothetical protein